MTAYFSFFSSFFLLPSFSSSLPFFLFLFFLLFPFFLFFCLLKLLRDDLVAPLLAPESDLARLPPTLIVLAEWDILHDEGVAMAQRINAAGGHARVRSMRKPEIHE